MTGASNSAVCTGRTQVALCRQQHEDTIQRLQAFDKNNLMDLANAMPYGRISSQSLLSIVLQVEGLYRSRRLLCAVALTAAIFRSPEGISAAGVIWLTRCHLRLPYFVGIASHGRAISPQSKEADVVKVMLMCQACTKFLSVLE